MKKSMVSIVVCFLMMLTLTACGSTDQASSGDEKTKLTITVWNYDMIPEFEALFSAYEEQNPNVTIEPIDIAADNYDEKLTTMLASGDTTDILTMKNVTSYANFASRGQLKDMTSYVEGLDQDAYEGALDYLKTDEGKYLAVPYRTDFWVLYYNKDIFDEAGIDYPENLTWEEYHALAKQLSDSSSDQVFGAYQHTWRSTLQAFAAAQTGGDLLSGNYEFMKPYYETILGMQADGSILDWGTASSTGTTYASQFENGQAAMMPMGTWYMAAILRAEEDGNTDVNLGITSAPQLTNDGETTTFGSPTTFAVNQHSKQTEEAEKFIEFATGEAGAKVLAKIGIVPAYRTQEMNDLYFHVDGMPTDEISQAAFTPNHVVIEMPMDENSSSVDLILTEEHELIMIGDTSIDEGIKNMEKRVAGEVK